jgi:hypothetical protein
MVSRYSRADAGYTWGEVAHSPVAELSLSVLQIARKHHVRAKPFPHIVLDNALPRGLYEELVDSFPSIDVMGVCQAANNERWDFPYSKSTQNLLIPQLWRDFLAYHSSQDFFDEVAALFYEQIHAVYPDRYPTRESLTGMLAGVRNIDSLNHKDILVEALISGNTPVTEACSVRTTHVDTGAKLFAGMFYMRPDDYDAVGGDLTISRLKPQYASKDRLAFLKAGNQVDDDFVEVVNTVQYAKNRLVLFINSPDSLHGVTVRQPTRHSRLFVNLVGEVSPPLFSRYKKEKRKKQATRPHSFLTSLSSPIAWLRRS